MCYRTVTDTDDVWTPPPTGAPMQRSIGQWIRSFEKTLAQKAYVTDTLVRTFRAAGLVFMVFVIGTLVYWFVSGDEYGMLECAYMTVITLTTVGYTEVIPVREYPGLQAFTIVLIVLGMGSVLYFVSSLTAFIVDGELRNFIKMRRMRKRIDELDDHFVVAGIGNTGEYVLDEMVSSRRDVLVIDSNRERLEDVHEQLDIDFPYIVGDATEDDCLIEAGIERADALVCSLGTDRDNLFVTISARSLNPDLRIVTRAYEPESEQKFKMAGASSVIYTNVLGGLRMAAEAIRPQVTTFLDLMMQDHGHYRRVEELDIPEDSPLVGTEIQNTGIREQTDALIIAVYEQSNDEYIFNPGPTYTLTGDTKLIVLTLIEDVERLESLIDGADISSA